MTQTLLENKTNQQTESEQLALIIAEAADDRKAGDIVIIKVTDVTYITDYFVIVTGYSKVQLRAISQSISAKTEVELNRTPTRIEGQSDSNWVLQDYGDVIVHILTSQEREFYNLEAFWGHGQRIYYEPDMGE